METARLIKESMQCFVDSAERIFDVLDAVPIPYFVFVHVN
jgi:hypothetical protein